MKIGFIGFGAAGYGLTKGLMQAGIKDVLFFDTNYRTPPYDGLIRKHAAETGAVLTESAEELLAASEIDAAI